MPSWVFWGVLLPWFVADLFALWFCFFFMADDPLQDAEHEEDLRAGDAVGKRSGQEGQHA